MVELSVRERAAEKARGARWFDALRDEQKGQLGDGLVLGAFDWRDWLDRRPSGAFMAGVDDARVTWEILAS